MKFEQYIDETARLAEEWLENNIQDVEDPTDIELVREQLAIDRDVLKSDERENMSHEDLAHRVSETIFDPRFIQLFEEAYDNDPLQNLLELGPRFTDYTIRKLALEEIELEDMISNVLDNQ